MTEPKRRDGMVEAERSLRQREAAIRERQKVISSLTDHTEYAVSKWSVATGCLLTANEIEQIALSAAAAALCRLEPVLSGQSARIAPADRSLDSRLTDRCAAGED